MAPDRTPHRRTWLGRSLLCELLFVALLSLVPLLWPRGQLLAAGDVFPPQRPLLLLQQGFSSWRTHNLGHPNLLNASEPFPYFVVPAILRALGGSAAASETTWLVLCTLFQGLSFLFLMRTVLPRQRSGIRMAAVLLYVLNPFSLLNPLAYTTALSYGMMPAFLALSIRGMRSQRTRYAVLLALVSCVGLSATANPPLYLITYLPAALYVCGSIVFAPRWQKLKFPLLASLLTMGANAFWIVLFMVNYGLYPTGQMTGTPTELGWIYWTSAEASLSNLWRLIGHWGFYQEAAGSPYYPYAYHYKTALWILIGFTLAALAFAGLVLKRPRRTEPLMLFFYGLAVLGLFLAKGPNPPLGSAYVTLYERVPGFWLFREPFTKFMPLVSLSFAVLLAYTLDLLGSLGSVLGFPRSSGPMASLLSCAAILLIGVNSWHAFTGETIPGARAGRLPGWRVEPPAYWDEMAEYINSLPEPSRVMLVPRNPFYQVHYLWAPNGYYGVDPAFQFIAQPLVSAVTGTQYEVYPGSGQISLVYDALDQSLGIALPSAATEGQPPAVQAESDLLTLLRLSDIRYILHRRDLDWTQLGSTTVGAPEQVQAALLSLEGLHLKKSIGLLDLYEVEDEARLARIREVTGGNPSTDVDGSTALSVRRVTSTRYEVQLDIQRSTCLVLAESFHPGWHGYVEQTPTYESVATRPGWSWVERSALLSWILHARSRTELRQHTVAAGYANQWCIPAQGKVTISLEYTPQRLFEAAVLLSVMTVLACLSFLVWDRFRGGRKADGEDDLPDRDLSGSSLVPPSDPGMAA